VSPPRKEKPLLGSAGLRELTTRAAYHALDKVQAPFDFVFWFIEQRNALLQDRIDNERSGK
jgi:hypothetical protein